MIVTKTIDVDLTATDIHLAMPAVFGPLDWAAMFSTVNCALTAEALQTVFDAFPAAVPSFVERVDAFAERVHKAAIDAAEKSD